MIKLKSTSPQPAAAAQCTSGVQAQHGPSAVGPSSTHLLSFAVEEYFHASPFDRMLDARHRRRLETRLSANVDRVLEMLSEHRTLATFFVLGEVADRHTDTIKRIAAAGHELAARTYEPKTLTELGPDGLRQQARRVKLTLEDIAQRSVQGFRVARGRLGPGELWALDTLAELGFGYDSSFYPRFRELSDERLHRFPFVHEHGGRSIVEFPMSTWGPDGMLLPLAGGNAMRQLPVFPVRWAVRDWSRRYTSPFNMFFHVWEFDASLPRLSIGGWWTRMRRYRNLGRMGGLLSGFAREYAFESIGGYLDRVGVESHLNVEVVAAPSARSPSVALPKSLPTSVRMPLALHTRTLDDRRRDAVSPLEPSVLEPFTVVIPCFNEAPTLPYTQQALDELAQVLEPRALRYIFVDDKSTDDTLFQLRRRFGDRPGCHVIAQNVNRGVASAIMTGLRAAETELVGSMDCDCTYDPAGFAELLKLMEAGGPEVALVTSSPYHPRGGVKNVPGWRLALSKTLSRMYRLLLRNQLYTYTSCFRVYRRSALSKLTIENGGFLGMAEMIAQLDRGGHRVMEWPAVLESRLLGRSKMKVLRTIVAHLRLLGGLVLTQGKSRRGHRRHRPAY